jgi:hypothetical protein
MPGMLQGRNECYIVFENFRNEWRYIYFPYIEV